MKKIDKEPAEPKNSFRYWAILSLALFAGLYLQDYFISKANLDRVTYSEFLKLVEDDKILDVTISESIIYGSLKESTGERPKQFVATPMNDDKLVERLSAKNIKFKAEKSSGVGSTVLSWLAPLFLLYLFWGFLFKRMEGGPGGLLSMTKSRAKVFVEKNVDTTFADVAGVDEAKEELREIINYLQAPEKYSRLGGRAPKGILLMGPPGTGKTLLAKAVAGEAKVPFFSINGSEFVELFVGLGAARVRDLFEQTREKAPCILFIDEIDALGKARGFGAISGGANDEKEQTLNQLLAEMDGFDSSKGVIILAATNRPEVLDPALLRAGRFDKQILIGNPDQAGRVQILNVHIKKIKLDPGFKVQNIASLTPGFSGADLANVVNEAALIATRRNADFVNESDFTQAIERLVAGLEQKKKLMNPEEKKRVAYHEMGHATCALALNTADKVHKVSIVPRGIGALGYTLQRPTEDRYLVDEKELIDKITVLLGGRASETIYFKNVSTGAADDLAKATDIARAMITQFGMSKKLGLAVFEPKRAMFLQNPYEAAGQSNISEKTQEEIDLEVKSILDLSFARALKTLESNKNFIDESVKRLLEVETLDEKELLTISKGRLNNVVC